MQVTKFTSGAALTGKTAQSDLSGLLQNMQLRYGSVTYPSSQYTFAVRRDAQCYMDFIAGCDAQHDSAGGESYDHWCDPVSDASEGQGRIWVFSIIKPSTEMDSNAELTLQFTGTQLTTRVCIFAIAKKAISITYDDNKQVAQVTAVPY